MTILLVEDDLTFGPLLTELLQAERHAVLVAHTLAEARAHLAAVRPEAALLDLDLPDGHGLSLMRMLRLSNPRIAVIVQTARDGESDRSRARLAQVDAYLLKPYDPQELLTLLEAATRARAACVA